MLWISPGRAARDETAFRHALATGNRLREAGQRMMDAKIIDAYEYAYNVAQAVWADHHSPEMPPQRDRQTMARRVRGYVAVGSKNSRGSAFTSATAGVGAREYKALATIGRKGGKKDVQRWNNRNRTYAKDQSDRKSGPRNMKNQHAKQLVGPSSERLTRRLYGLYRTC